MIVSRLALDSALESSRNAYTTTCSRRHKYVERYFTLIPVQFTPFWQQWHKAVLHCRFPWRSKTVRFHQNLLLQLLLATATVRAIKNIYTYRYHSLFRSCFFCRTPRVQARKEALASPRIRTVIFFIQSTNACTPIYLGTRHQLDID